MNDIRKKMKIVYMGTPEFAVAPLQRLIENDYEIAGVVTVPDKPAGRGLKPGQSDVKRFALREGLPLLQPVSLKDPQFLDDLKSLQADLFIVVAFRMLPKAVWSIPPMGTFNLHGSLLPQYRGAAPINWAVINGEKESGVTTFFIDEQIDTGAILLQERCLLEPRETVGTLYGKLMRLGAELVVRTVRGLEDGSLRPRPQSLPESVVLNPAPKLTRETGRIRWIRPAEEIDRLVRGLSPYPAASATLSDGNKSFEIKIFGTELLSEEIPETGGTAGTISRPEPGTVFSDGKSYLHIACGEGVLALTEIQLAGKKRMQIREFLLGFRRPETFRFV